MQPSDIHDATWGVVSAVYGGAVHPTAEGHAAMADAALAAARQVLGLASQAAVSGEPEPLPPPPREVDPVARLAHRSVGRRRGAGLSIAL